MALTVIEGVPISDSINPSMQASPKLRIAGRYTPPGYEATKAPKAFMMVFDGDAYQSRIPTPTILDNLIAEHRIPPVVAAFVFTPEDQTTI